MNIFTLLCQLKRNSTSPPAFRKFKKRKDKTYFKCALTITHRSAWNDRSRRIMNLLFVTLSKDSTVKCEVL